MVNEKKTFSLETMERPFKGIPVETLKEKLEQMDDVCRTPWIGQLDDLWTMESVLHAYVVHCAWRAWCRENGLPAPAAINLAPILGCEKKGSYDWSLAWEDEGSDYLMEASTEFLEEASIGGLGDLESECLADFVKEDEEDRKDISELPEAWRKLPELESAVEYANDGAWVGNAEMWSSRILGKAYEKAEEQDAEEKELLKEVLEITCLPLTCFVDGFQGTGVVDGIFYTWFIDVPDWNGGEILAHCPYYTRVVCVWIAYELAARILLDKEESE